MNSCIVIAKLIGMLNTQPIEVYKLDCLTENKFISIVDKKELIELTVVGINNDLTYNMAIKDRYEITRK